MAEARKNDLLGRLADLSEEAVQRLGDAPGADRLASAITAVRERVDELQKRMRGMEGLEQRLAALEHKVDKLAKASSPSSLASGSSSKAPTTKSSGASRAKKS